MELVSEVFLVKKSDTSYETSSDPMTPLRESILRFIGSSLTNLFTRTTDRMTRLLETFFGKEFKDRTSTKFE